MNVAPPAVRARAFDAFAEEYDRFRPGYPDTLFDTVAEQFALGSSPAAVDLGTGTGKVARAVAARGWRVTGVDPGRGMLDVLQRMARQEGHAIKVVEANAEATGLPDAAFDVALAGEAWHWFDAPRTLAEVARIVRAGGGFAFFWNVVDEDGLDIAAAERALVTRYGIDGGDIRRPGPRPETRDALRAAAGFQDPEFVAIPHAVRFTGAGYLGWARTKSHLRTAPADLQARYLVDFEQMLTAHGIGPEDEIVIPFIVDCWMAARSDR
jgi:SAM-dependent methyltransferase